MLRRRQSTHLSLACEAFVFLNGKNYDHRSAILLDRDWFGSRQINELAESVLGIPCRHVLHESPLKLELL